MAAFIVASFTVTDPQGYEAYRPLVVETLAGAGAEVLVADYLSEPLEGQPPQVTVILRFASKAAARAWYNSPSYQAIVHLRTDNSTGTVVLADEWVAPT